MVRCSIFQLLFLGVFLAGAVANTAEIDLVCSYSDKGVATEFDDEGTPSMEFAKFGEDDFTVTIDRDTGTAKLTATGSADLIQIPSDNSRVLLNLVEMTPSGLSIITIFRAKNGRHPFVQSRHFDFLGPFPQQYYGTCKMTAYK